MKLKHAFSQYECVDYYGIKLIVRRHAKCIATNKFGHVCSYQYKPHPMKLDWEDRDEDGDLIAIVDLDGMDWRETLMEIK